jgi:hypothetical protein
LPEDVGGPFSLALIPLNSLAHFSTIADRLLLLRAVRERLAPGARLALDVDLDGPRRLASMLGVVWHLGTWDPPVAEPHERDAIVTVSHLVSATRASTDDGLLVTHFFDGVTADGQLRRSVAQMSLALLTRDEVQLTLERAGFVVEDVYGSYELEPYEPGTSRAIFVAHSQPAER